METSGEAESFQYPDLKDRHVVVAGGTGDVGEGIVRAWLKTGAQVTVPSRTDGKIARFREAIADIAETDRLSFVTGVYDTFNGAQALAVRIVEDHGAVTDVVAALGGWWQGKYLWDVPFEEWHRYFIDVSTAHFANARAWSPRLPAHGTYQLILGGASVKAVPKASIINMSQAGLLMMRRVLSAEVAGRHRVVSQILGPVVTRSRRRIDPQWLTNEQVGLASAGIAARPDADATDYASADKAEMLQTLRSLGLSPVGPEAVG